MRILGRANSKLMSSILFSLAGLPACPRDSALVQLAFILITTCSLLSHFQSRLGSPSLYVELKMKVSSF